MEVSSSAVNAGGTIPSRYTCDGADMSLPVRWKGVPAGTAELMLDIIKIEPVNGRLYFPWAVAGLKPTTRGIDPDKLPAGAVVATNSGGQKAYDLCPPKGSSEAYVAILFALPHSLAAKPGFNPTALRLEGLHIAKTEADFVFHYKRH